ncbi:MAG: TonB-dependent receptor [Cellvibrionales bacterium]|nr:TonB-dependent receptor [Cellvibrionales bacterium]
MRKGRLLSVITASLTSCLAFADHAEKAEFFEEITIVGTKQSAQQVTGSAHVISDDDLEIFSYTDIQRILRSVPGVNLQVEDGYGLRPNIGIRGVPTERSARVVLLEDNVPVAPAPYAASSAYYFPTMGRMYSVEVLKGPSAITQGPNTIGGAINFVSTPIPTSSEGNLLLDVGEDSTTRIHANYGSVTDSGFGYMLETHQWKSDGFQTIDNSNTDTGLDVEDYTVKFSYAPADSRHALELKYQYAQQDSNQTYLGLTDADFKANPYRRYGVSALDNIATEHNQLILRHEFTINDAATLTTTAYNNEHKRSWYKLQKLNGESWGDVIEDINVGGADAVAYQAILDGGDSAEGAVRLRDNNRQYYSRGVALKLDVQAGMHDLEVGLRLHKDEEDRLQQDDNYTQVGGSLALSSEGVLGAAGNRVAQAEALAFYVHDTITMGDWVVTPGIRFEDIELTRREFTGGSDRVLDPTKNRDNSVNAVLPSLGALYQVNDSLSLLAGAHSGFGSPTSKEGTQEEESINYELGGRYQSNELSVELIAFMNDYDNLVGECTASSGGSDCTIGDTFNGGAAMIKGIEFSLNNRFDLGSSASMPIAFVYTYSDAQFDSTFDSEFFGNVSAGDDIPYIPEQQMTLNVGFEQGDVRLNASVNYVDAVCVNASCGAFEKTEDSTTLDLSANYQVNSDLSVFARLENATAEEDIVGRQPYGARPNKARTAAMGIRLSF